MRDLSEQLSAYLDGELGPAASALIEERLATDPAAQAELDALMEADAIAQEAFEAELDAPVPFALAQQIKNTEMPLPETAVKPRPIWGALAASLVVFAMGGVGGYALKGDTPAPQKGWIAAVADYHGVYASQGRHLVEVGADESDHIETWLGNTVGATFTIPDMTQYGLTFEGGRLLVANGKPVAQLMYRDPTGAVVALCLQRSNAPSDAEPTFKQQTINDFDFVSWSAGDADYVVIGPTGFDELNAIATTAALEI